MHYVIPDIHGNYKAFLNILEQINFSDNDTLILLGDIVDGWSESYEIIEHLKTIKNLVYVMGNHDEWCIQFLEYALELKELPFHWFNIKNEYFSWLHHGGMATVNSYKDKPKEVILDHIEFLKKALPYYKYNDMLFIHAGYSVIPEDNKYRSEYLWDRGYVNNIMLMPSYSPDTNFDRVFIGHTPTIIYDSYDVIVKGNVYLMDCGVAFTGKLSCYCIETDTFYYSDYGMKYYPDELGRNDKSYNNR